MLVLPLLLLLTVPAPPPLDGIDPAAALDSDDDDHDAGDDDDDSDPAAAAKDAEEARRWSAPRPDPTSRKKAKRAGDVVESPFQGLVLLASVTGGVAIVSSLAGVVGYAFTVSSGNPLSLLFFLLPAIATPATAGMLASEIDGVDAPGAVVSGFSTLVGMGAGAIGGAAGGYFLVSAGGVFPGSQETLVGAVLGGFLGAGIGASTCASATATTAAVFFE